MQTVSWDEFKTAEPDLSTHVEERLGRAPCYLGTVRPDGWPRVHPVGPLTPRADHLVVTMYPTSPKGKDLERNGIYALHAAVEDTSGGGGEVLVTGLAIGAEPTDADRSNGYVVFELLIGQVLATRYDPTDWRPIRTRWRPLTR